MRPLWARFGEACAEIREESAPGAREAFGSWSVPWIGRGVEVAMKAGSGGKTAKAGGEPVAKREEEEAPAELQTELALGSDGRLYVNAEGVDPEKIKGRKMFVGFAMTEEEAGVAVEQIHRMAFNVTVAAVPMGERRPKH